MAWPDRLPGAAAGCDWTQASTWQFLPYDAEAFPAVALARRVGALSGTYPAIYNAANEECVAAFQAGALPFLAIVDTVAAVVEEATVLDFIVGNSVQVADVLSAEAWARDRARVLSGLSDPANLEQPA
jgi:1-deoxy-D-xylulose-5-phosphate reductoisomerase